ncbi:MAG: DUF465 domain-containing protein [Bryobacteraceae bacterium]
MATNEEFRRLSEEHSLYHKQLERLEAKSHLTGPEQIEEVRLKKLKLHLKDQMTQMMAGHGSQRVA